MDIGSVMSLHRLNANDVFLNERNVVMKVFYYDIQGGLSRVRTGRSYWVGVGGTVFIATLLVMPSTSSCHPEGHCWLAVLFCSLLYVSGIMDTD